MIKLILDKCPHVKILLTTRVALTGPNIIEKIISIEGLKNVTAAGEKVPTDDEKACWELFKAYNPDMGRNEQNELRKFKVDKKHYAGYAIRGGKEPKIGTNNLNLGAHHIFDLLGR